MVNAQEWLDNKYPLEERKKVSKLDTKNTKLEGKLVIRDWPELKIIISKNNNLTEIELINLPKLSQLLIEECQLIDVFIKNCPEIKTLDVKENKLTSLDFFQELNPEKLAWLNIQGNCFQEHDLSFLSKFVNLERLTIKNRYDEEKFKEGTYNQFVGSLEPLKNLRKLKYLNISNTDIDSGLEFLPDSVVKINCWNDWKRAGCGRIRRDLEKIQDLEGVTEKLWGEDEGDPDPVKHSNNYYRLAPYRQAYEILLEKKPLVQNLKEKLKKNEETISELEERLKKEQSRHDELQKQLELAEKREQIKEAQEKDKRIKDLEKQVEELIKSLKNRSDSSVNIYNNVVATASASVSNQIIQIQYNDQQLQEQLSELKQNYQILDQTKGESDSDSQKLKRSLLFLAAKQNLVVNRQKTIKILIATSQELAKSDERYSNVDKFGKLISSSDWLAGLAPVPASGTVVNLLGKGVSVIANFFKSYSQTEYNQRFVNYLIIDEKALTLLKTAYHSLNDSLKNQTEKGVKIAQILSLDSNQLDQCGVFTVANLQQNEELTPEKIKNSLELLTNHLKEFTRDLYSEQEIYAEKLEKILSDSERENLVQEIEELLNRLSEQLDTTLESKSISNNPIVLSVKLEDKKKELTELVSLVKNKLENKLTLPLGKKKLVLLLENLPVSQEDFVRELNSIKPKLSEKLSSLEIEQIYQLRKEVTQLRIQLDSENTLSQIQQIPFKS